MKLSPKHFLFSSMRPVVFLFLILILTFAVYRTGLSGAFVFDDIANIASNIHISIRSLDLMALKNAAVSSGSGPLGRPISMMSFAINYYFSGSDPYFFKITNLIIHLLTGISLFILTRLLLHVYQKNYRPELPLIQIRWLSLGVSSAWLLHPLNLTSVLYIVQRMTSLSAVFTILGLIFFVWGRELLCQGNKGYLQILIGLLVFTPLAAFSKENGTLLSVLMLIVELALFSFRTSSLSGRRFLAGFYILSVGIPAIFALSYLAIHSNGLVDAYQNRDFTLSERLMTEARVLWFYIRQIMLPDIAQMGLYLDDFHVSHGLLKPFSTLFSLAGILVLGGSAFLLRIKAPLVAFGILFFLSGHLLESTIYPLDLAYEHRNYLPMYGIILPMFYYLLSPIEGIGYLRLRQVVAILLIVAFAFTTYTRASSWANPMNLFESEYRHHPNSARNNVELGYLYNSIKSNDPVVAKNYLELSRQHFENAVNLDKSDTGGLFGLLLLNAKQAKPIDPNWINELSYRLEHQPYAAATSDRLLSLTNCQLGGECKLSNSDVKVLLEVALRNPTLSGSNRTKILYAQSSYLINIDHDYTGAVAIMHQMIKSSPKELAPRMALINFLMALKRPDEVRKELKEIRALELNEPYMQQVAQVEQQLAILPAEVVR